MVFAYVCEELGLVVAVCMIAAVILMALFAIRCARNGRSAFYAIAACSTSALMLVQLALNVFGTLDMLPFTGVTFPFVSRGGSSLLACWMLIAFLKAADNRRGASFAVNPVNRIMTWEEEQGIEVVSWGKLPRRGGKGGRK
jgi:cell division protein FtsW (lipid II flippase)